MVASENVASKNAASKNSVWPVMSYKDASGALEFLEKAFGFEITACFRNEEDPSVVEHAQVRWPGGGGVMLSSHGTSGPLFAERVLGNDSIYVVCDDPDALFERATGAGAEVGLELKDEDYGSRGFTVRDPEGNLWSFGTYAGE